MRVATFASALLEIAIHDSDRQRVGILDDIIAVPAGFRETQIGTAVAVVRVAIVALFSAGHQPISTGYLDIRRASDGYSRLQLAGWAAAITRDGVSVIATFAAFHDVIATNGRMATLPIVAAVIAGFHRAVSATVPRYVVSVVALFCPVQHPVAAVGNTGDPRRTDPARFHLALCVASVFVDVVSVIALLVRRPYPILAYRRHTYRRRAGTVPAILNHAIIASEG
jgi:hypothetical protein